MKPFYRWAFAADGIFICVEDRSKIAAWLMQHDERKQAYILPFIRATTADAMRCITVWPGNNIIPDAALADEGPPIVVVVDGTGSGGCHPGEFLQLPELCLWADTVTLNYSGLREAHATAVVEEARSHRRILVVETTPERGPDWFDFVCGLSSMIRDVKIKAPEPAEVPFPIVRPADATVH